MATDNNQLNKLLSGVKLNKTYNVENKYLNLYIF